jgi:hypothetical protein
MTDAVRQQSDAVLKMQEDWTVIDGVMGGTKAMRAAGTRFLPRWPAEEQKSYEMRLATATLFPAYERTVSVMTGKPFSKPITVGEDVPARVRDWLENVDTMGRNLDAFAADLCAEALGYGLAGILVDYPKNTGLKTVADEQVAGVRPYFVHVCHDAILGWRAANVNGAMQLLQLRILETVSEPDGPFADKVIEQVRVLEPGSWATWRKARTQDMQESWMPYESGTTTLPVIPFVPIYGKRKDFMIGTPPMLELAHQNIEHWQSKSDQQTILHIARVPILFTKDLGETPMSVGAGAMISASSKDADAKYVEHTGAAIEAGRHSILDLEDRMRQTGAELLIIKPGNTTEVQTVADNEQGMCDLQRIMQTLENALDKALDFMAQWVGIKDGGGHVTIYRDFGAATLAEASANLLYEMRSTGDLSEATLLAELKRRGILSPDIDIDEEKLAAKADAPAVTVQETVRP